MQNLEAALRAREEGFDGLDSFGRFLVGACGYVDFGIVGIEDLGELLADAAGGAGDDEDLWFQV